MDKTQIGFFVTTAERELIDRALEKLKLPDGRQMSLSAFLRMAAIEAANEALNEAQSDSKNTA